jgi:hypothetical protein
MDETKGTVTGSFGCSRETMGRIARTLGMTSEELARSGLDLDVLDAARWVVEQGIEIEGLDVRKWWPPGFRDCVAIATGNLQVTVSAALD